MNPPLLLPANLLSLHAYAQAALADTTAAARAVAEGGDEDTVQRLREALTARERALLALGLALASCAVVAPPVGPTVELVEPAEVHLKEASQEPILAEEPTEPLSVPAAEPEAAPPQPAPPAAIEALRARFSGGGAVRFASPPPPATLRPLFQRLRPPTTSLRSEAEMRAERDHIALILAQLQAAGPASPKERHAFLTALAARLRVLQENGGAVLPGLERLFGLMAGHAQEQQLGFVHGLRIDHRPASTPSWSAEAEATHLGLRLLLGLGTDLPGAEARFAERLTQRPQAVKEALQCAIAAGLRADHPALAPHIPLPARPASPRTGVEAPSEASTVPIEASLLALTAGKRALIVGGDQRGDCRERLIGAFGFASLDWETGTKVRRVGATAERLRQGGVDIAIFLKRFISHSLTNQLLPAADKGGVTVAWVDQGYGAAAVAEALRKALGAQLGLAA